MSLLCIAADILVEIAIEVAMETAVNVAADMARSGIFNSMSEDFINQLIAPVSFDI